MMASPYGSRKRSRADAEETSGKLMPSSLGSALRRADAKRPEHDGPMMADNLAEPPAEASALEQATAFMNAHSETWIALMDDPEAKWQGCLPEGMTEAQAADLLLRLSALASQPLHEFAIFHVRNRPLFRSLEGCTDADLALLQYLAEYVQLPKTLATKLKWERAAAAQRGIGAAEWVPNALAKDEVLSELLTRAMARLPRLTSSAETSWSSTKPALAQASEPAMPCRGPNDLGGARTAAASAGLFGLPFPSDAVGSETSASLSTFDRAQARSATRGRWKLYLQGLVIAGHALPAAALHGPHEGASLLSHVAMAAAGVGDDELVTALLAAHPDLLWPILESAARNGQLHTVELLQDRVTPPTPESYPSYGHPSTSNVMAAAARGGHVNIVRFAQDAGWCLQGWGAGRFRDESRLQRFAAVSGSQAMLEFALAVEDKGGPKPVGFWESVAADAAAAGAVTALTALVEAGKLPAAPVVDGDGNTWVNVVVDAAMAVAQVSVLQFCSTKHAWRLTAKQWYSRLTYLPASIGVKMANLRWAVGTGQLRPANFKTFNFSGWLYWLAANSRYADVDFLRRQGCAWPVSAAADACAGRNLPLLQYIRQEQRAEWDPVDCIQRARARVPAPVVRVKPATHALSAFIGLDPRAVAAAERRNREMEAHREEERAAAAVIEAWVCSKSPTARAWAKEHPAPA